VHALRGSAQALPYLCRSARSASLTITNARPISGPVKPNWNLVVSAWRRLARAGYRDHSCTPCRCGTTCSSRPTTPAGLIAGRSRRQGWPGTSLIDLLLAGRVAVVDRRLDVVDRPGPATSSGRDPRCDQREYRAVRPRAWVSWISHGACERIGDGLIADGSSGARPCAGWASAQHPVSTGQPRRTWYGYEPGSVRGAWPDLPEATAALCGLVRVLRLHSGLLLQHADIRPTGPGG
jgi:hypothetical protein